MILKPHQTFALEWLREHPRAILAMQQRLGKTPVALLDIDGPTTIIVPAFLKLQWFEECQRWRPDLKPRILRPGDVAKDSGNIWIVNFEILQDVRLCAAPGVIVDEGHYCKSHETQRTITTLALCQRAAKVRWLTGTLMPNRSMELWPVMTAVGATEMDANAFGVRYAGGYQDQWGKWNYRNNTATDELRAKLDPRLLRITRAQIGMPDNEWKVIALDLPLDEREKEYDLAAIARDPRPIAFEGLADLLHFQGRAKTPQAISYIDSILMDEPPVLVFAWHKDVIANLATALGRRWRVEVIIGGMSDAERQRVVKKFQAGELDAIVSNVKAGGVGLPLHMAERVVFVEGRWTPADMEQAADRGVSMDRPRSMRVDVLTVHKSIDEFMVRRCLEKTGVIDRIIQPSQEFATWQRAQTPHRHPRTSLLQPFAR